MNENQLSFAHNISNTTKFEKKTNIPPHNNRTKYPLLKSVPISLQGIMDDEESKLV